MGSRWNLAAVLSALHRPVLRGRHSGPLAPMVKAQAHDQFSGSPRRFSVADGAFRFSLAPSGSDPALRHRRALQLRRGRVPLATAQTFTGGGAILPKHQPAPRHPTYLALHPRAVLNFAAGPLARNVWRE